MCIHTYTQIKIVHENPRFSGLSTNCIYNKDIGDKVKEGDHGILEARDSA